MRVTNTHRRLPTPTFKHKSKRLARFVFFFPQPHIPAPVERLESMSLHPQVPTK